MLHVDGASTRRRRSVDNINVEHGIAGAKRFVRVKSANRVAETGCRLRGEVHHYWPMLSVTGRLSCRQHESEDPGEAFGDCSTDRRHS